MYVSTSYVTLDVCTLLPCYSLDIRIIRYWLSVLLFVVILLFFRELLLSIFLSIFEIVQCLFWILSARINCLILKKFLKKLLIEVPCSWDPLSRTAFVHFFIMLRSPSNNVFFMRSTGGWACTITLMKSIETEWYTLYILYSLLVYNWIYYMLLCWVHKLHLDFLYSVYYMSNV